MKGELGAPRVPREVDDLVLAIDQTRVLLQCRGAGAPIEITKVDAQRVTQAKTALGMRR